MLMKLNKLLDEQALQRQDPEDRYITDRINWEQYETMLAKIGDAAGYRVTYLDGVLEIMAPSRRPESGKTRIGDLLLIYFVEADINYFPFGSTTLRQEEKSSGIEPDEAYCIGTDKEFPDLAIEVTITSGGINKLEVYRRLNVREVWFWQNQRFSLYYLQEETPVQFVQACGYELIQKSEVLPDLDIELLTECMKNPNSLAAVKEFRQGWRSQL
ncbi:Uma2 family endonuclease [Kamptonema sp. UHCC 0994]|uniref:Uma2 family endonuclease n=1 Tax=Kamptonema sp. UHCC 0994 TaxID=3031329 RepID=UPI0023BAA36C|nr:Uma2 family endonuclease [Kamptonema sp. UHCC 0994]MDF0556528.1 Uma2 family endonuclease [Kamptonema sp. UHCC 0994]